MSDIRDAAGHSLTVDAAMFYYGSQRFREAFDRAVVDHLPLRARITVPIVMRLLGRFSRQRISPWRPSDLIAEITRRSSRVPDWHLEGGDE